MKPTTSSSAWIAVFAFLLAADSAAATEVRGTIEVGESWLSALAQRTTIPPEPPTLFWEVGNGAASIDPPIVDIANEFGILVRRTDQQPLDPLAGDEPVIEVRNMAFQPAIAFVPEGRSLVIKNLDLFDHDFVVEPDKGGEALPKEDLDGGRSFRVRFNASGLYVLRCENFAFLRGYILVDKSPVRFVHPADDGSFSLGDLPPGQYSLTVFNATAQAAAASNQSGWIANPCPVVVPPPAPAPAPPPAAPPAEPPEARHRPGEEAPAAAPPPPPPAPPPAFQVVVRLGAQGTSEKVECPASFPQPPAPAAPAAPPAAPGPR